MGGRPDSGWRGPGTRPARSAVGRIGRAVVPGVALLSGVVCGEGAGVAPAVTVRDSAGITIAQNPPPDDSLRNRWWRVEGPVVDIGGADATEAYALFRVSDALRLDDGRLVIANGGGSDIRYYDASGRHVLSTGRAGGGPGEFRSVSGLERGEADSLLVLDGSARRISVLDGNGTFARDFGLGDAAAAPRVIGRLSDGSLVSGPAALLPPDQLARTPDGVVRPPFTLMRFESSGTLLDTIGVFPGAERVMRVESRSGDIVSVEILSPAYAKSPTFAVSGDELYVASQDAAEIRVHGPDGALRRIVRTGRAAEPVTPAHIDALIERRVSSARPERRAGIRAAGLGGVPAAELVPPYGEVRTDLAGNLWVSDYDDPTDSPGRWTVYGPGGRVLARIVLPERFRPFDIGTDWILGRELDDLDVEHVRLYRIVRD